MNLTTIGKIQKTFGTHGELMLALYNDFVLPQNTPLFISIDGLNVPFYLKSSAEKGSKYVVIFDNMESEKRALELVGKELSVELSPRQHRKHTAGHSSAISDELIGYSAWDQNSGELGMVSCWLDYPGNPCLQIINAKKQEIIIPANIDLIVSIDKKEKKIMVDLPQGLLEIYMNEENQ